MDTEQIIADLNRRFAEPLPEFYPRRIIVWHDEEKEFVDKIDEIRLDNAKVAVLTGTNYFAVKKLLAVDDTDSNYLLYSPFAYETLEDNWLLDIELYSEEFRADLISMWLSEMGLPQTPSIRSAIKPYRKFMNAKERRKKITAQTNLPTTAGGLHLSIMAALAGIKDAKPAGIIKAVLKGGLDQSSNRLWQNLEGYHVADVFWRMVAQGTGYDEEDPTLGALSVHLMVTAASRTIRQELLIGLERYVSEPHQANCYALVSDWLRTEEDDALCEIAEYVESEVDLQARFMKLTVDDLADTEMFPCVNEIILVKLMRDVEKNIVDPANIRRMVEKRRTCAWFGKVRNFYDGLHQVAQMQEFYKLHADGFHTVDPRAIWTEYTESYYRFDAYYRAFHKSYDASLKAYPVGLSDLFASVKDFVEGMYINWFLEEMGENWSNAVADPLREHGRIFDVPQQTDFYRDKVRSSDARVYVIISDAMRYEVAAELAEALRRETQSKVELSAMQGVFPTVTKFGMAALLPHEKLSAEIRAGRVSVLADGESTEAPMRDKVLKSANPKSVALKYRDVIGMKRAERGALVKGMDVVYIYHDAIDEAGHTGSSIFGACEMAIEEIKNMVRVITGEFGGVHILITADHGFLYTDRPLQEDEKVDRSTASDQDVEIARRYAILKKGAAPDYLLPVRFLGGETEYEAFAPRGSSRIKMKGGGLNFVHGGASLQEMVVPLIDYRFLRNDSKEYKKNKSRYDTVPVTVSLLSSSRKISNMAFSLNFYQKEAVAANFCAAVYLLYFTDSDGKTISDVPRILADKTEENAEGRIFRVNFNLKPLKYSNDETYYLVIADSDGLPICREEFLIDIALPMDEFDFFG